MDKNPRTRRGDTPLHDAAMFGHFEIFMLTIPYIIDKNPRNFNNFTPLHYAAHKGYLKICKYLLENVEDINPTTNTGFTPLDIAVRGRQYEIIEIFDKKELGLKL